MKAIVKNATVTEENAPLVIFAQSIDFTELCDHVKDFTGANCKFQQPGVVTDRSGGVYIEILSDDITYQTGPFSRILKKCQFQSDSNGVCRDRESGELKFWVIMSITYSHKDGGSNGMEVCRAWYNDSEGWIFKDMGDGE